MGLQRVGDDWSDLAQQICERFYDANVNQYYLQSSGLEKKEKIEIKAWEDLVEHKKKFPALWEIMHMRNFKNAVVPNGW